MLRKIFKVVLGTFITGTLCLTSIASACPSMNNMSMPDMSKADIDHACDLMGITSSDPSRRQGKECCNFADMMPCKTNDLLVKPAGSKLVIDWTLATTASNQFLARPPYQSTRLHRPFFPPYILKSQITYLQTSRLRI